MGEGFTNKEMDHYFGIKKGVNLKDAIIRRPEMPYDELTCRYPTFSKIPYDHMIWLGCPVCTGEILIDGHIHQQRRICERCSNVFKVLKKGEGRRAWFEYVIDADTVPEPWMRATL